MRFQTLLSWKSVSGIFDQPATYYTVDSFKPCCHGSRSAAIGSPREIVARAVSNLVVMEVGQRHLIDALMLEADEVSNLVVMEVGQRLHTFTPTQNAHRGFQTLLSWKSVSGFC